MKSSKVYGMVFILRTYCADHQSEEPWLAFGFVVDNVRPSRKLERELFDYLWSKGFNEGLCLTI